MILFDSDNIKKLFSDFNPKKPEDVHELSSKLAKEFYKKALKDKTIKDVAFTMGGGGSGKSELIVKGLEERGIDLVMDGTGKNYEKLLNQVNQALEKGKKVEIKAVFIDWNKAKAFNAKRERSVPEHILKETHIGYRETLKKLLQDHPDLDIEFVVNTGKMENGKIISYSKGKDEILEFLENQIDL